MKFSPKHYRLLFILEERGSVPAGVKPVVMNELISYGLAERYCHEEWRRIKDRYRLTDQGRILLEAYNEKVQQDRLKGPWQGRNR